MSRDAGDGPLAMERIPIPCDRPRLEISGFTSMTLPLVSESLHGDFFFLVDVVGEDELEVVEAEV
jgi:hypothetical protein